MEKQYAIQVKDVKKSFRVFMDKGHTLKEVSIFRRRRNFINREVLKGISFDIEKGETVALIGHNGCGKSTTLKLLTKIMYPDSGEVMMNGKVSSLLELGAGFHPDMSGRENIYINASIFGLTKEEIDAKLGEIIEFSELEEFIDNPVRTYSSGMYMRLAFAVAINVDAEILLIDEILAVGDVSFQAKCYNKMLALKESGVTIVLVTHDMETVNNFCDRAIWLNEGLIMDEGPSYEVVDRYMKYMSAKQMTDEDVEKKDRFEDIRVPAYESMPLHFGNKKAEIISCEILNSKKEVTDTLYANENYSLKFKFKVNEPMDELIFGMGIYSENKIWIFGTNNTKTGVIINVKDMNKGEVLFESSPLNLLVEGEYILQCSIIEPDETPCDYYNDYARFKVIRTSDNVGIVDYETKWTFQMKED